MSKEINLKGQRFGRLTVIEDTKKKNNYGGIIWLCRCDCGNLVEVNSNSLKSKNTKSCGCLKRNFGMKGINLIGQKFGRLTVVRDTRKRYRTEVIWLCKCDCDSSIEVVSSYLRKGDTKSCGCLKKEKAKIMGLRNKGKNHPQYKHGDRDTSFYRLWKGIKCRCHNQNYWSYKYYGGRGIKICPEWRDDYRIFKQWAFANGYKPGLVIDRINNDGNYTPDNCQWITRAENTKKMLIKRWNIK